MFNPAVWLNSPKVCDVPAVSSAYGVQNPAGKIVDPNSAIEPQRQRPRIIQAAAPGHCLAELVERHHAALIEVAPPLTVGNAPGALGAVSEPGAETTSAPVPMLDAEALASDVAVPEATTPPLRLNVV